MKRGREIKIGSVFLLGVALLYFGLNFLKGKDVFNKRREFYAIYSNVKGLMEENNVMINGKKVGQISDISFIPGDTAARIIVKMVLYDKIPIPDNSVARIESDLLGTNSIHIKLGNSKKMYQEGDTMISELAATLSEEVNQQLLPVKRKAENLMLSLDSVLATIQAIFNEQTRDNLVKSFESIKLTIQNLEHTTFNVDTLITVQRNRIDRIFANIESISYNIKTNNDKINNIINNFSSISDSVAKANVAGTLLKANQALTEVSEVMAKINSGQGSLGMLINNDSLYKKLDQAAKDLDELLIDMKAHPNRYVHFSVFGRNPNKGQKEKKSK